MIRSLLCLSLLAGASCERSPRLPAAPTRMELGRQIYLKNCQVCHGVNGAGIPDQFPPFQRNPRINGDSKPLIAVILDGMKGGEEIDGVTYRGTMPAWRDLLADHEIAAVLTFIRASWTRGLPEIQALEVRNIRDETAMRKRFWTTQELNSLAAQARQGVR